MVQDRPFRRDALRMFASVIGAVLFTAVSAVAQQTPAQDLHLTILHTNDTHGHLLPYSYPDVFGPQSDIAKLAVHKDIGGAARRATLVKRIRGEKDHETLLIDAGDICDGTPFSTEYHGEADIAAMNSIGYDLACPGNHEYNNPLKQVQKLISLAKFPLISANSVIKADGSSVYTPYVIRTVGGIKIAFFGLMTYDARTYPAARTDIQMELPIDAARRIAPELRKKADLVVAVTHIGVDEDVKLAAEVPDIDVIIGGHSHTLLPHPLFVPHADDHDPHSIHGAIIVQDFQWAGTLGRLDLVIHHDAGAKATVARYNGQLLPITGGLKEDASTAAVIDKFWKPIAVKYGRKVGVAAGDFAEKGQDYANYNLVADAVREQTGAEVELENPGGVRAPLAAGDITYGDAITMDPFGNTIVTFKASGKQIKAMLLSAHPAVSGITYTIDHGQLTVAKIGGADIDDDRVYSGATNNYLARTMLKGIATQSDTGKPRLDALLVYLSQHSPVKPLYDGRRTIISTPEP